MPVNNPSKYPLRVSGPRKRRSVALYAQSVALVCAITFTGLFLLPQIITVNARHEESLPIQTAQVTASTTPSQAVLAIFPVSVDPATKSITDNPNVDELFRTQQTSLTASVGNAFDIVSWIAALIDNTRLYQSLAAADGHLITIQPGYRKEEVVEELSQALNWNKAQQQQFIAAEAQNDPGLTDGMFAPGNYVVDNSMTPASVAALMNVQFDRTIVSHYSTTTASQVPLAEALTVASLLEREAAGPTDMRIISGIIWNRLFKGMNLQIDATLQYAKGDTKGNWWPAVLPKDKYIASAFNTYAHPGLPPGPIANPSVAAVLAALNPVKTSCVFYFHDSHGVFHCSDTYVEHVALLKKYYGQGK